MVKKKKPKHNTTSNNRSYTHGYQDVVTKAPVYDGYYKNGDVRDIAKIKEVCTFAHVDSIVSYLKKNSYFIDKYDKQIQEVIGHNNSLLEYYHRKMKVVFGEHALLISTTDTAPLKKDNTTHKTQKHPKHSSKIDNRTWILDWNCVSFYDGYYVIFSSSTSGVSFVPCRINDSNSKASFNFIRKYIAERLPPVFCTIVNKNLTINNEINLKNAILQLPKIARQHSVKSTSGRSHIIHPLTLSFSQAMSKASQMTKEEFKKYKSKYIDHLLNLQSEDYKVIPCTENISHLSNCVMEESFIFSINCRIDKVLVVLENVNPDRSTLLFYIEKEKYMTAVREIHSFIQSAEVNKRSGLRDGQFDFKKYGVVLYESINHDDDFSSWKFNISIYTKYK